MTFVPGDRTQFDGAPSWGERFRALHLHLSLSRRAQFFAMFFLVGAAVLIPWTIFLGLTLPPKFHANHWRLLWTGFDASLIVVLLLAAWAAWYRRQILAALAVIAGTLLFCDAWFDMVTSFGHRDEWLTLLTGFGAELPLGVFFFWLYRRIALTTMTSLNRENGGDRNPQRLRDLTIVQLEDESLTDESGGPSTQ
jgi:hypothetical protein